MMLIGFKMHFNVILSTVFPAVEVHVSKCTTLLLLQFKRVMLVAKSVDVFKGKVNSHFQKVSCVDPFILPLSLRTEPAQGTPANLAVELYMVRGANSYSFSQRNGGQVQVGTLTGCFSGIQRLFTG